MQRDSVECGKSSLIRNRADHDIFLFPSISTTTDKFPSSSSSPSSSYITHNNNQMKKKELLPFPISLPPSSPGCEARHRKSSAPDAQLKQELNAIKTYHAVESGRRCGWQLAAHLVPKSSNFGAKSRGSNQHSFQSNRSFGQYTCAYNPRGGGRRPKGAS